MSFNEDRKVRSNVVIQVCWQFYIFKPSVRAFFDDDCHLLSGTTDWVSELIIVVTNTVTSNTVLCKLLIVIDELIKFYDNEIWMLDIMGNRI